MTSVQNNLSQEEMLERMRMLRYKVHETELEGVWKELEDAGFEPILIKGWAAAQFYPQPYRREFSDIDIAVAPERFTEATMFLKNHAGGYPVDLHKGVRRHDTLPFGEILSASKIIRCGAVKVRIPRVEDHLRILCAHWLTDGGARPEKLWDIYYAVANRSADFDWQRLLNVVSPTRRRWVICTIGLAHKYLGLPVEDTPLAEEAKRLPRWLIKAVESEWLDETKLQPLPIRYADSRREVLGEIGGYLLQGFRSDRKNLWKQISKRLSPNPIQATVEVEGEFDARTRIIYQLKNFRRRLSKLGLKKDDV